MNQSKNRPTVAIIQRLCPHYRRPFFQLLANQDSFSCTVLTSDPGIPQGKSNDRFQHINFYANLIQFPWGLKSYKILISIKMLMHIWSSKYDVVIAEGITNMSNNIFLLPICRFKNIKFICWDPGRRRNAPRTIWRKLADPFFNWMIKASDACIAYSSIAADYLQEVGANSNKVFIAHNSIALPTIDEDNTDSSERRHIISNTLGITGHKIILFVGVVERRKKIEQLIQAFQIAKKSLPEATSLLIIGDGNYLSELIEWTSCNFMEKDVHFLGKIIDGVDDYFRLCDIFVLPSEGGLALNQAMAHGKPVIASSADGTEIDLIKDGYNGFLLEEDNIPQLADYIEKILVNSDLAQKMGNQALMTIQEKFTLQHMVDSFTKAITFAIKE